MSKIRLRPASLVVASTLAFTSAAVLSIPSTSARAQEPGTLCQADVVSADAMDLTGTGDEVIRGELQSRALLRNGPDGRCPGAVQVPAGATVQMLDCGDDWCLVVYGTDVGFVPVQSLAYLPDRVPDLR